MDTAAGDRTIEARSSRRRPVVGLAGALAGLVLAGAAGCGGDGAGDAGRGQTGTTATSVAPNAAEASCEEGSLDDRAYILCVTVGSSDQGLVVALHGRASSADEMRTVTQLDRHAADAGLAVVYPQAIDGGWGDDTFRSPARQVGDEDVEFLDALVRELRADQRIDDGPIGVVGFSNGASMALRYTSEHPDDVRAVVSVAGQLPRDPAVRPSGRVPWPSSRGQFSGGENFGVTSSEVDASAEAIAFVLDPEGVGPIS